MRLRGDAGDLRGDGGTHSPMLRSRISRSISTSVSISSECKSVGLPPSASDVGQHPIAAQHALRLRRLRGSQVPCSGPQRGRSRVVGILRPQTSPAVRRRAGPSENPSTVIEGPFRRHSEPRAGISMRTTSQCSEGQRADFTSGVHMSLHDVPRRAGCLARGTGYPAASS